MKIKQLSLQIRIFVSMIILVLLASILIAGVTIYQYKEQTEEYNEGRLERKELSVKASINYWLESGNTFPVTEQNLKFIFKEKIFEISDIEKLEINIYNLKGNLVLSSFSGFVQNNIPKLLPSLVLQNISKTFDHRYINISDSDGKSIQSSYTYIVDNKFKPIGILNLRYEQDNSAQEKDLEEFLIRLGFVYFAMFLFAIGLAYFISSYITRNLKAITDKMKVTNLQTRNEKIVLQNASSEISTLVNAYNNMIDQLEKSALKLAKSEREHAWREMAKQVAHEIKNPLTPMRLTVQNFQRKFDQTDPRIHEKVNEHSKTIIQQIDTLSSIAEAFSNFAKMPTQNREIIDVIEVVKHAIDVFSEEYISFHSTSSKIIAELDKSQLIRVITNLITNSIQALEEVDTKNIEVTVADCGANVEITLADNGKGISDNDKAKIFEPKFTTKSSGMGLGLPMVKNIIEAFNGTISFTSVENKGTVFKLILPKK